MPVSPDVLDLLADLQKAFRAVRARWFLFGAQAVIVYGLPRLSDDVDVTVDLSDTAPTTLVDVLRKHHFRLEIEEDADSFAAETRVLPFTHLPTAIGLDVVLSGPGFEEEIHERAVPRKVASLQLPVIAVEDLIVLKILAGRGKDLDDVEGILLLMRDRLDLEAARSRLNELEDALGQSDLTPALERLVTRVKKTRALRTNKRPVRSKPRKR